MTRHAEFEDERAFGAFVRDQVLQRHDWRSWRRWRIVGSGVIVLEAPEGVAIETMGGARVLATRPTVPETNAIRLADLWRRARPVPRGFSADAPPECYLLLPGPSAKGIARLVIEEAPGGLEAVKFESLIGGKPLIRDAFLLRGEAGRLLAHSPPEGCRGLECDRLPLLGGGLAAFPIGWSLPSLPERLWPSGENTLLEFFEHDGSFTGFEHRIVDRLPLVAILDGDPRIERNVAEPTSGMHPSPWRVVRGSGHRSVDASDEERPEGFRVVFRIRTFTREIELDQGRRKARVHELGHAFLQILDECEAGVLPHVEYAAVDHGDRERWHFLIVDRADDRLLTAWGMLERFEYLEELGVLGINAFLSRDSRMVPPAAALIGGGSGDRRIPERIRALLGNPAPETLVLIEDLEGAGDPLLSGTPSNPRLVHIDRKTTRPLASVLESLVKDWNNAEPLETTAESVPPEDTDEVRAGIVEAIHAIGGEEDAELGTAAGEARAALARWADEAALALSNAAAPVAEAEEVCRRLVDRLSSAETSLDATSAQLARYCQDLTAPRRAWIGSQNGRSAAALAAVLPTADEAKTAISTATALGTELRDATEGLDRATDQLRTLESSLDAIGTAAADILARAEAGRKAVEARAASIMAEINERIRSVTEEEQAANRSYDEVTAERTRLEEAERSLAALVDETRRIAEENTSMAAWLSSRRRTAEAERRTVESIRDTEIPRMAREAEAAESRLTELDPAGLRTNLQAIEGRLRNLTEQEKQASRDRDALQEQVSLENEQERQLQAVRRQVESLRQSLQSRRRDYAALERNGPGRRDCERKIRIAEKALARLDGKASGGFFAMFRRMFGGGGS